ncbi:MAG: HNH endonuclease [Planctomycetia bacterium]|nr:HNH endonuclease [Planctomycetia bacterium]
MKPKEYRNFVISRAQQEIGQDWEESASGLAARGKTALAEQSWVREQRPYYNIWPIVVDLAQSVKLDVPFSAVAPTFRTITLRFARGHEPPYLTTALLSLSDGHVFISCPVINKGFAMEHHFGRDDKVEDWLLHSNARDLTTETPREVRGFVENVENGKAAHNLLVRLFVFVGLLSHDDDLITPIVLSKDQERYATTDDPDVKKWLEDRAARRAGRGFDVGKNLQLERQKSPHWRNPHLCLFWIGPGRRQPIIQMRSGAVIQRVSMADIPTGYLGPEKEHELDSIDGRTPRETISKSRRFNIMKRDGFRCQLCGATQQQGTVLHVDHQIPLAKGGSNEDGNLWTLCERCNLGKSDREL